MGDEQWGSESLRPIGEDMPGDPDGDGHHQRFEPAGREDIGTEEERGP